MSRRISTVISRGEKSAFVPFVKIAENVIDLRWGKKDEVEKVGKIDESTGKYVLTGEVKETDYCTYELCRWYGELDANRLCNQIMSVASREATVGELNAIMDGLGTSDDNKLPLLKEYLLKQISNYDGSSEVNQFFIGGFPTWLDKATRVGLKLRFEAELAQGMQQTTLWQDGVSFPLPLVGEGNAFNMLNAIELYASACYDNTQKHIAAVRELSTVEELVSYDFRSGYPQKLEFGK